MARNLGGTKMENKKGNLLVVDGMALLFRAFFCDGSFKAIHGESTWCTDERRARLYEAPFYSDWAK